MPRKEYRTEFTQWNIAEIADLAAGVGNYFKASLAQLDSDVARWSQVKPEDLLPYIRDPRELPYQLCGHYLGVQFFGPSPRLKPFYEFLGNDVVGVTWRQERPRIELDSSLIENPDDERKMLLLAAFGITAISAAKVFGLPTHPHDPRVIVFPPPRFAEVYVADAIPLSVLMQQGESIAEREESP